MEQFVSMHVRVSHDQRYAHQIKAGEVSMKKILVVGLTVCFIIAVMILAPLAGAQESGKKKSEGRRGRYGI